MLFMYVCECLRVCMRVFFMFLLLIYYLFMAIEKEFPAISHKLCFKYNLTTIIILKQTEQVHPYSRQKHFTYSLN